MPPRPSRRLLLTGALTGVLTLGGCGVRLEDDAPDLPFVPEREPIPGEAALLAMLGAAESRSGDLWRRRESLLRTALLDADVPEELVEDVRWPQSRADTVTAFEAAVRDCGPGLLPLVGALTAARIRESPEIFSAPSSGAWRAGEVAAADLDATRAATYAVEVIAAQGGPKISERARSTRSELRGLAIRQTTAAGEDAGSTTLGYDLPTRITDAASAERLAEQSLVRLVARYTDGLARLGGDRTAALETAHWMVTAQQLAEDWGADTPAVMGAEEA